MSKMSMKTYNIIMPLILITITIITWNDISGLRLWLIIISILLMMVSQVANHFEKKFVSHAVDDGGSK